MTVSVLPSRNTRTMSFASLSASRPSLTTNASPTVTSCSNYCTMVSCSNPDCAASDGASTEKQSSTLRNLASQRPQLHRHTLGILRQITISRSGLTVAKSLRPNLAATQVQLPQRIAGNERAVGPSGIALKPWLNTLVVSVETIQAAPHGLSFTRTQAS